MRRHHVVRLLINAQVTDLVDHAHRLLEAERIGSLDDVRKARIIFMRFSPEFQAKIDPFKRFLYDRMYRHYRLVRMKLKAERMVHALFDAYFSEPRQLAPQYLAKIDTNAQGGPSHIRQVVCDYIAGMTDRYAMLEYRKLFDPFEKV
jgi:dGTPase